jgi:hypothetical protein
MWWVGSRVCACMSVVNGRSGRKVIFGYWKKIGKHDSAHSIASRKKNSPSLSFVNSTACLFLGEFVTFFNFIIFFSSLSFSFFLLSCLGFKFESIYLLPTDDGATSSSPSSGPASPNASSRGSVSESQRWRLPQSHQAEPIKGRRPVAMCNKALLNSLAQAGGKLYEPFASPAVRTVGTSTRPHSHTAML